MGENQPRRSRKGNDASPHRAMGGMKRQAKNRLEGIAMGAVEQAKEMEQIGVERVRNACNYVKEASDRAVKSARRGITNYPIATVAAALAAGVIIGLALSRRRE